MRSLVAFMCDVGHSCVVLVCVCELPRSSGTRQLSQRRPIAGGRRRGRSVPCLVQFVLHLSYTDLELCGASCVSIQFGVSIVCGTLFWVGKCKARVREYAGRKCRESWGPRVPGSLHRGLVVAEPGPEDSGSARV